jgi:hypothetical protein
MRHPLAVASLLAVLVPIAARATIVGPTALFTLPAQDTTPSVFGSVPFPVDLYFDQGQPGDGDGTLLNAGLPTGNKMGLATATITVNTDAVEDSIDLMKGFGTTSGVYFFFDGPLDPASLPASPVLAPSLADGVFCADVATLTPVPVAIKFDVDSRIPNVLSVLPLPGRPLKPKTRYTCVVRTSVTGAGAPVEPSADWLSVRDGTSANTDADAIFDSVVTALGGAGVPAVDIAGMTVFTTEATTDDLVAIRDVVLPGLPVPTANFSSRPELVFNGPLALNALMGALPHGHIGKVATGYFPSPQFQTADPNGAPPLNDLPLPPSFVTCAVPCETSDERFTHDPFGRPAVITTAQLPVTVVIPSGTPPPGGWPVVIQQHGLGGQRDTVVVFGEDDAAKGFASIGIDAQSHGYRFFNCGPGASCSQDTANNFGGTASPDGFADGTLAGFSVGFLTTNLGFFQGFHNFIGIRDNFRQTYADLLQLVRLLHGHSIDTALGTTINDGKIFYMGHSLGGLMGAGFVPIEADVRAALLNAAGGGLLSQLFQNSSIGAGNQALINGILGLDPANVADQFSLEASLVQMILDPADGVNSAKLLLAPVDGAPRNVIQVEDWGDQVVPNQSNETLALAAGLPLFDPFVQNLHFAALPLPIVATHGTVSANVAGGLATAAVIQNGPATHAASTGTTPGTLTFVPEFGLYDEFPVTGAAFPPLLRGIRVPNAGILGSVLDWFGTVASSGGPGTFTFGGAPDYNPVQNVEVPGGASTQTFFARTVSAGGAAPFSEPTPDVTVAYNTNVVPGRVTAGRSTLGSSSIPDDRDVPPGPSSTVGTLGFLPFFVTLQQELPGLFGATLTIAYTPAELEIAGIPVGSADESGLVVARFSAGSCTIGAATCSENADCGANGPCIGTGYTALPTTVSTGAHTATATGVTSAGIYAVVHADALAGGYTPPLVPGGGGLTTDCRGELEVVNPNNTPFLDVNGHVSGTQTCQDGDPTCDADRIVNGSCSFRVAVCLNQPDASVPGCAAAADSVSAYRVQSPSPSSRNPSDAANAQALIAAVASLGGSVGGPHLNAVTFTTPVAATTCAPLSNVVVPVKNGHPGKKTVRGRAETPLGKRDADRVKLICNP